MSNDNEWDTSFVIDNRGPAWLMVIEKGITAVLTSGQSVNVGEFFEVKTAVYKNRGKEHHCVAELRRIDPLGPVRIGTFNNHPCVYITTTAAITGYVDTEMGRRAKLENNIFGSFIDLDNLIRTDHRGQIEFEFKSLKSPRDPRKSMFIVTNVIGDAKAPQHRDTIIGFVGGKSPLDSSVFVWSKFLKDDTILFENFFPVNGVDVAGRWIEMAVDDRGKIVQSVMVIRDLFETRICNGYPEVLVTFQHNGKHYLGFNMFYHEYFGDIADPHRMIKAEERRWYRAWIIKTKIKGADCQWKISREQETQQTPRNSTRDQVPLCLDSRDSAAGLNHGPASPQNGFRQYSPPRTNRGIEGAQLAPIPGTGYPGLNNEPRMSTPRGEFFRPAQADGQNSNPPRERNQQYYEPRTDESSKRLLFLPTSGTSGTGRYGSDDDRQLPESSQYPEQRTLLKLERTSGNVPGAEYDQLDAYLDSFLVYSDDEEVTPAKKKEVDGSKGVMQNPNNSAFVASFANREDFYRRSNVSQGTQGSMVAPANNEHRAPTLPVYAPNTNGTLQVAHPMSAQGVFPIRPTAESQELTHLRSVNGSTRVMQTNNRAFGGNSGNGENFYRPSNVSQGTQGTIVAPASNEHRAPTLSAPAPKTIGTLQVAHPMSAQAVFPIRPTAESRELTRMRNSLQRLCDIGNFFIGSEAMRNAMRLRDPEQFAELVEIIEKNSSDYF